MLKSVQFKNFKVLRDATLPLSRFTLIVGPNGSGKSTAMQAIQAVNRTSERLFSAFATAGLQPVNETIVEIVLQWSAPYEGVTTVARWGPYTTYGLSHGGNLSGDHDFAQAPSASVVGLRSKGVDVPLVLQGPLNLCRSK